jgi:hypothetical protein
MPKGKAPTWDVHPGVAHVQAILRNLEANTGKDLDAWVALVKAKGPADEEGRRAWLKDQGLGGAQAMFVAERSFGASAHAFDDTPEGYLSAAQGYVEAQYAGKKAALRPCFEALVALARSLGPDVRLSPCETIVPIYRAHVIAQIKPFASRLDLGLALGDPTLLKDPQGRLIDTGGFAKKDRITVKLEVRSEGDLDADLKGWLKRAYDRDA